MKRLRKFNESENDYIDYDYVYQCFAELLDDERAEIKLIERDSDQTEPYITITLKTIVDIDHKTSQRRIKRGF